MAGSTSTEQKGDNVSIFPGLYCWFFYQRDAFLTQEEEHAEDTRVYLYYELDEMSSWDDDDWENFYRIFVFAGDPDVVGFEKEVTISSLGIRGNFQVVNALREFVLADPDDELDVLAGGSIIEFRVRGDHYDFRDSLAEALESAYTNLVVRNSRLKSPFMSQTTEIHSEEEFFKWYAERFNMKGELYDRWMNEGPSLGRSVMETSQATSSK